MLGHIIHDIDRQCSTRASNTCKNESPHVYFSLMASLSHQLFDQLGSCSHLSLDGFDAGIGDVLDCEGAQLDTCSTGTVGVWACWDVVGVGFWVCGCVWMFR
jgi:hypothetical protein